MKNEVYDKVLEAAAAAKQNGQEELLISLRAVLNKFYKPNAEKTSLALNEVYRKPVKNNNLGYNVANVSGRSLLDQKKTAVKAQTSLNSKNIKQLEPEEMKVYKPGNNDPMKGLGFNPTKDKKSFKPLVKAGADKPEEQPETGGNEESENEKFLAEIGGDSIAVLMIDVVKESELLEGAKVLPEGIDLESLGVFVEIEYLAENTNEPLKEDDVLVYLAVSHEEAKEAELVVNDGALAETLGEPEPQQEIEAQPEIEAEPEQEPEPVVEPEQEPVVKAPKKTTRKKRAPRKKKTGK